MKEHKLKVKIVVRAPYISQGTGAMRFGLDVCPNTHNGKLVLPGRLLKGVLREKLEQFTTVLSDGHKHELEQVIHSLFGQSFEFDGGKGRAALHFPWRFTESNIDEANPNLPSQRHRIKIDAETGSVEEGHLQIVDTKYPTGTKITFEGDIYFSPDKHTADIDTVVNYLNKAASQIKALGAYKNVGFGQVVSFDIVAVEAPQEASSHAYFNSHNNCWPLAIKFNQPICFSAPNSQASNHFESNSIIAGNIIKGGIANEVFKLDPSHPLRVHFDELIVRHAIPSATTSEQDPILTRFKQPPLSLIKPDIDGKPLFVSVAQHNQAILFKDLSSEGYGYKSGVFCHDWKEDPNTEESKQAKQELNQMYQLSDFFPTTSFSVHTAIDSQDGIADEGQLYSMQVIESDNTQWLTEIELPEHCLIDQHQHDQIAQALAAMFTRGIPNMGKTKARMQATTSNHLSAMAPNLTGQYVTIKLETDALLFDDTQLQDNKGDLLALYHQYFAEQLQDNPALKLHSYYADQTLGGGNYYYHHFGKAGHSDVPIINYLTKAGSVFTFEVVDKTQADQVLNQWHKQGFPLPRALKHITWKDTPYLPQNGFGEISVLSDTQANYNLDKFETITLNQTAGGCHV